MQIGLDFWATLLLRNRVKFLLVICLLTFLAVVGAANIRFEDGLRQVFQSEHSEFKQFEESTRNIPQSDNDLFILVNGHNPLDASQLEALRGFILDSQLVEGVTMVTSIFSAQRLDRESGHIVSVIPHHIEDEDEVAGILADARANGLADISLINRELTKTVLLVSVDEERRDMQSSALMMTELNVLIQDLEVESGLTLSVTGLTPIRRQIVDSLGKEQIILNVVGGIIGSIISLCLFRSLWIGALNGVAPTFSLLFTLGAFGLFGISMNVITSSVTVLILVIAMADSIHMTHELRRKLLDGQEIDEALRMMLVEIGPPALLISLTTMVAFASLHYSQSELVDNFAIAGLAGLCATIIAVFVVHALVYRLAWQFAPVRQAFLRRRPKRKSWSDQLTRVMQTLIRRRRAIIFGGFVTMILLLTQFFPVQTDHRFSEYLNDDDPLIETLAEIEAIGAPSQAIYVSLKPLDPSKDLISNENLGELSKAHALLTESFPENTIFSLESIRELQGPSRDENTQEELEALLDVLPVTVRSALLQNDQNAFVMSLLVKDEHSEKIREMSARMHQVLGSDNFQHLAVGQPTGLPAMAAHMSDVMIKELIISFLITALLCPVIIGFWYRNVAYGLASILPNVLPILMVGMYLIHSGRDIQFTSAIALTIAFGVAVDDTIHLINRYHLMRSTNADQDCKVTIIAAVRHVAPALITTTCVLAAGLSSSFLSDMPSIVFFGALCIGIFTLALLTDLLLLPPALVAFERQGVS